MIRELSIADTVSIINAIFGIIAIIFLTSNLGTCQYFKIQAAFTFILLGLLADGLDGTFARKFGKSEIGVFLDSMADMTSFVIAPSVFVYFVYSNISDLIIYRHIYLIFALILFLSFGIIRLASFHLFKEKKYFYGLPAPASAIVILLVTWFRIDFVFILPIVIIIGALMASDIKYPKMGLKLDLIAAILILLSIIFYDMYNKIAPLLLLIAICSYAIFGPIYLKFLNKGQ